MIKDELETPRWMFEILNEKFKFDVDLCAKLENKKTSFWCADIFSDTPELYIKNYDCKSAFMNPPYSDPLPFIKRALELKFKTLVMVLPVDTSTKWWATLVSLNPTYRFCNWESNSDWLRNECIHPIAERSIIFMPKRVKFEYQGKPTPNGGQRPTCVVIVRS